MTFDIFANRQDKPKFESFYRTQESMNWNPSAFKTKSAIQKMLLSPTTTVKSEIPIFRFPRSGE